MAIEENYESNHKMVYTEKELKFMYIYKYHANILTAKKRNNKQLNRIGKSAFT